VPELLALRVEGVDGVVLGRHDDHAVDRDRGGVYGAVQLDRLGESR